jgi:uncharacterized repeat protein (TIGR01451 family)
VLLGIPPDAQIELRVLGGDFETDGPFHISPVAETVLLNDPLAGEEPGAVSPEFEERYLESPDVFGVDAPYPGIVARLAEVGYIRRQRVAAVDLFPVQYNPFTGQTAFYSHIQIELTLSPSVERQAAASPRPESPAFKQLLDDQLLNYASAREWQTGPVDSIGPALPAAALGIWPLPSTAYKIPITETGLYQLTYAQLDAAGLPVGTLDPRTLQMFLNGAEIAIRVVGEQDGDFHPTDDYVLFYGQGIQHKYTGENVYWLTYGQGVGRRMPERNGTPSGLPPTPLVFTTHVRVEEDLRYQNKWPGGDDVDRWYWVYVNTPPQDVISDVDLGNVSNEVMSATLWASMWGFTSDPAVNPDHLVEFYVNDQYIGQHAWDGNTQAQWIGVDFPQSYLDDGVNSLRAHFPGASLNERVMFDRFELDYGHDFATDANQLVPSLVPAPAQDYEISGFATPDVAIYDVSSPHTVTQIVDAAVNPVAAAYSVRFSDTVPSTRTYLVLTPDRWLAPAHIVLDAPSDLHEGTNGADYIVISYADFLPAAEALATHRMAQGLRTKVVDLEDVYDEFGYGLTVPEAIQSFLRYAFEQWQPPAPTYVVLLGDGTYDPKGNYAYMGYAWSNYVPSYLANVDQWMLETAADNRYVSIIGDDIWPDMILGRLPANSLAEANEMVTKTIAYEQSMKGADWNRHLIFVAGEQPDPKAAGNFHDLSDILIDSYVMDPYWASRVFLGTIPGSTCSTGPACQQLLLETINVTGTLLVNYIGHSARNYWSSRIMELDAIDLMTNSDRFPIMLPMTCLDGYHIIPGEFSSLSEKIVRAEDRGAVASWAPTGLGVAYGHDYLNRGFLEAVFKNGVRELGPATYAGKWRLYKAGISLEQIEEYTLMGDPALRINAASTDLQFEKVVEPAGVVDIGDVVTYTLSFTNPGPETAYQVLITDVLPSVIISPSVLFSSAAVLSEELSGLEYTWAVMDLLPHTGGEIRLRAVVSTTTGPGLAVNVAGLHSSTDVDHSNNVMSTTNEIPMPDPAIVVAGPAEADSGDTLTYTVVYSNEGPLPALQVRISDELPPGVSYLSDDSGLPHSEPVSGAHVWEVGELGAGARDTFRLVVEVGTAPGTGPNLTNTAWIEAATPDGDFENSESQWFTSIRYPFPIYLPVVSKD